MSVRLTVDSDVYDSLKEKFKNLQRRYSKLESIKSIFVVVETQWEESLDFEDSIKVTRLVVATRTKEKAEAFVATAEEKNRGWFEIQEVMMGN